MQNLAKKLSLLAMCALMVTVFTGCITIGAGPNRQDLSKMIAANFPKVVSIETFNTDAPRASLQSRGSGVIIYSGSDFSLIATNHHVISYFDAEKEQYAFYNFIDIINWSTCLLLGKYDTALVAGNLDVLKHYTTRVQIATAGVPETSVLVHAVEKEDLAIIKVTFTHENAAVFENQAATLRQTPLRVGEPIAALGYSFGEFHRASVGIVSQVFPTRSFEEQIAVPGKSQPIRVTRTFEHAFMHDATTIFGNSGGPVFDAKGELVGLTTLTVMVCCSECKRPPAGGAIVHHCEVPAFGYSIALSARHIANVVNSNLVEFGISK